MEQQNQQPIQEKTELKPPTKVNWKLFAIVTIVAIILVGGGILLLSLIKIDKCFDRGSRWDYESSRCVNIDTSDWQTYRNDEFGFEVKYPKDWGNITREEINEVNDSKNYQFSNEIVLEEDGITFDIVLDFDTELFDTLLKLKPGEKFGRLPAIVYTKLADLTIAGLPAIEYSTDHSGIPALIPLMGNEILLKKAGVTLRFVLIGLPEAREKNRDIYSQILSTFRFVDLKEIPSPTIVKQSWREKVSIDLPKNWDVIGRSIIDNYDDKINGKIVAGVYPDTDNCSRSSRDVEAVSTEEKNINGLPFTVVLSSLDDGHQPVYLGADYCIIQGNNSFSITFYDYNNSSNQLTPANAKLFDQVASSIKFIE